MDKRSDDIRQDIEGTRAALDEKLDMLQGKASEAVEQTKQLFDVKLQVGERPWVALGLALAAGYVVGNLGEDKPSYSGSSNYSQDYSQSSYGGPSTMDTVKSKSRDFLSQFDDEIDLLKTAAISTLTMFVREAAREAVPALGPQIDKLASQLGSSLGGSGGGSSASGSSAFSSSYKSPSVSGSLSSSTPSSSPNNSLDYGTHEGRVNNDSIPQYNRVGSTPTIPTKDEEEYYTTYQPDEDTRETGGR